MKDLAAAIFFGTASLVVLIWLCLSIYDHFKNPSNAIPLLVKIIFPGIIAALPCMITWDCYQRFAHPEVARAQAVARAKAVATANAPHLLYQKDGCDVYRFRDGIYHYFTRCPNASTTTIGQHEVTTHHLCGPRGQQCSETHVEQEEINTESN